MSPFSFFFFFFFKNNLSFYQSKNLLKALTAQKNVKQHQKFDFLFLTCNLLLQYSKFNPGKILLIHLVISVDSSQQIISTFDFPTLLLSFPPTIPNNNSWFGGDFEVLCLIYYFKNSDMISQESTSTSYVTKNSGFWYFRIIPVANRTAFYIICKTGRQPCKLHPDFQKKLMAISVPF